MRTKWLAMIPVLALLCASCQRMIEGTAEGAYLFDGHWILTRIGPVEMPLDDADTGIRIKQNRLFEAGTETGSIEKIDGRYVMTERKSGRKYPCDMKVTLQDNLLIYKLIFHTPADDPDFNGRDVVYTRVELQ